LKDYGIINLDDRKTIYKAIIQLIAAQKRRDSQLLHQSLHDTQDQDAEIITSPRLYGDEEDELKRDYSHYTQSSISEDEEVEAEIDHYRVLSEREKFVDQGFCEWIDDKEYMKSVVFLIRKWLQKNYDEDDSNDQQFPLHDIGQVIVQFYAITLEAFGIHIQIRSRSGDFKYSTLMANISLGKKLVSRAESNSNLIIIEKEEKVTASTLEHILVYLGHHKQNEHDLQWTDGNNMTMNNIVADSWDSQWINTFDTNTLSLIEEAARHFNVQSLVQLAKMPMITNLFSGNISIWYC